MVLFFKTTLRLKGNLSSLNDTILLNLLPPKPLAFLNPDVAQHLGLARQPQPFARLVRRKAQTHPFNGIHRAHMAGDLNRAGATGANTHAVQVSRIAVVWTYAMADEYLTQLTSFGTMYFAVIKIYDWHETGYWLNRSDEFFVRTAFLVCTTRLVLNRPHSNRYHRFLFQKLVI